MVKGVNKNIIEVNNTGSKLFEKIVFYITPEYGKLNAKQLNKAINSFTFQYRGNDSAGYLRKKHLKKRRIFILSILGGVIFMICGLLLLIL